MTVSYPGDLDHVCRGTLKKITNTGRAMIRDSEAGCANNPGLLSLRSMTPEKPVQEKSVNGNTFRVKDRINLRNPRSKAKCGTVITYLND